MSTSTTTVSGPTYEVKDMALAEQGANNIQLAEYNMGSLMKVRERFAAEKPLAGIRIAMALHVTKETAVLVRTLQAGGADVAITGCNPLSTQDDVAAALARDGVKVYAYKGENSEDYYRYLEKVIAIRPHITIDDGCDLVAVIHQKHRELLPEIIAGCEETTTGVIRLKAMAKDGALNYPVIAVNDNVTKHLLDNYYGTGQSTWDGIIRATSTFVAGKTAVIVGYGSCGKGCALRGAGLGAKVVVCEVDNFRALQAAYDGYTVLPMAEAAKVGDIFITVTGNKHVIRGEHVAVMKDGAILCNSGHFDAEIDINSIKAASSGSRRVRPFMEEYRITSTGRRVYVLGDGRLVNLAAAEGHPSEVMTTSFCGQALATEYAVKNRGKLATGVLQLPAEVDDVIAGLQLTSMGVKIDTLTAEQKKYLASWDEGTA
jgi:adenosylhomocysteinase